MAIQFQCPSCQAMIRVPDAAAGKKGTCPRCNEKLLVPDVVGANPAANPGPAVTPSSPIPLPGAESSRFTPGLPKLDPFSHLTATPASTDTASDSSPFGLPKLDVGVGPGIGLEPPRKLRAARKPGVGAWIVPILCICGVAGYLAWYIWESQPKLEGALVAHTVHDLEVKPGLIPGTLSGLKADDLGEVLRHLKAEPAHWASSISKFTLTGTDKGVEVSVRNGTAAHFVSVSRSQSPTLAEYLQKHLDDLDKPRLASIKKHAPILFEQWKQQFTKNEPISNQQRHRDLVLLPTLVSGLGYHLEAVVNGNIYPCVYEDEEGELYFLLPNATKSFVLQGRRVAGSLHIPAHFTVKISGSTTSQTVRKKSKRKTPEEREAENEGMNPDLDKPETSETPQNKEETLDLGQEEMLSEKAASSATKSKSSAKKRPAMMEDDEEMMNDEMPARSLPKKKPASNMPKD